MGHIVITAGFFCSTTLLYKPLSEQREKDVDLFFTNLATPLYNESSAQAVLDNKQRKMLGVLISSAGAGIMTMFFLPNAFTASLIFVLCGGIVLSVGLLLIKSVDSSLEEGNDEEDKDKLPELS
jgi:hypothetical protein